MKLTGQVLPELGGLEVGLDDLVRDACRGVLDSSIVLVADADGVAPLGVVGGGYKDFPDTVVEVLHERGLKVSPVVEADLVTQVGPRGCPEHVREVGGAQAAVQAREQEVAQAVGGIPQTQHPSDVDLHRPVHQPLPEEVRGKVRGREAVHDLVPLGLRTRLVSGLSREGWLHITWETSAPGGWSCCNRRQSTVCR